MWGTVIQSFITIIGFMITYNSMRKTFQHEILQRKASIQLDKMKEASYDILKLVQDVLDGDKKTKKPISDKEIYNRLNELFVTIFAYGSTNAIKIFSLMQKQSYSGKPEDAYSYMVYFVLLSVQIRFDITGEPITVFEWFRAKVTDYEEHEQSIIHKNNEIINNLNLNESFLIQKD